jgi:hypothetical protein
MAPKAVPTEATLVRHSTCGSRLSLHALTVEADIAAAPTAAIVAATVAAADARPRATGEVVAVDVLLPATVAGAEGGIPRRAAELRMAVVVPRHTEVVAAEAADMGGKTALVSFPA